MERASLAAKVAIIAFLIIGFAILSYAQNRSNRRSLPESAIPIDTVTNTIKAVSTINQQQALDAIWDEIEEIKQQDSDQNNRIDALETKANQ